MSKKTSIFKMLLVVLFCLIGIFSVTSCEANSKNPETEIIIFYSPTCPHCHKALEFLSKIAPKYNEITITKYNTNTNSGANYYFHYAKKLGINSSAVPLAIFGGKNYELGFGSDETTGQKYITHINEMLKSKQPEQK